MNNHNKLSLAVSNLLNYYLSLVMNLHCARAVARIRYNYSQHSSMNNWEKKETAIQRGLKRPNQNFLYVQHIRYKTFKGLVFKDMLTVLCRWRA